MKKFPLLPLIALALATGLLFGLSAATRELADANAQQAHLTLMQTLLPGSSNFIPETYAGDDSNIRSVYKGEGGYVIETVTAGYAGEITMFIGVSQEGTVTGLVIRDMAETPGLGTQALTDVAFLSQFLNSSGDAQIGNNVDGISGATVTSKAVARCINSAVAYVTGADADSGATSWGG